MLRHNAKPHIPNLIYRGVPVMTSPGLTSFDKKLYTLILIEIEFSEDLYATRST